MWLGESKSCSFKCVWPEFSAPAQSWAFRLVLEFYFLKQGASGLGGCHGHTWKKHQFIVLSLSRAIALQKTHTLIKLAWSTRWKAGEIGVDPPMVVVWGIQMVIIGLLICQGSFYLIKYYLSVKGPNSMSQGLLIENPPTKVKSTFSHGIFYTTAQKGYGLNESDLTDWEGVQHQRPEKHCKYILIGTTR